MSGDRSEVSETNEGNHNLSRHFRLHAESQRQDTQEEAPREPGSEETSVSSEPEAVKVLLHHRRQTQSYVQITKHLNNV